MASGTSTTTPPPAPMRRTPGIGPDAVPNMNRGSIMPPGSTAGVGTVPLAGIGMLPGTEDGMTEIKPLGPLKPVLVDGFDRSLLGKLYPDADDPAAAAMAAAEERIRAGTIAEESLTQPFYTADGVQSPGNPVFDPTPPADATARGAGQHRPAPGENDPPVAHGLHPAPQQSTSTTPPRGQHDDDKDEKHDKKNDKK